MFECLIIISMIVSVAIFPNCAAFRAFNRENLMPASDLGKPLHPITSGSFLIFIMMFVITSACQANAETAWIKWEHESRATKQGKSIETSDNWYLQEAFPSYVACTRAIHSSVDGACGYLCFGNCKECSESVTFIKGYNDNDGPWTIEFYCYPDTIDPRKK